MAAEALPLLILGGTGRIGAILRQQWPWFMRAGLRPIWQSRHARPGFLQWDILNEPCLPSVAAGVVLCLAGVTRGTPEILGQNEALAMAACRAAAEQGARHVFLVSSAAVYQPSNQPLTEAAGPAPPGAYGAAKLAMEKSVQGWHQANGPGLTILRVGNVAGSDALLGGIRKGVTVTLDPVPGAEGGPLRSYIGPITLSSVLARLAALAAQGKVLPRTLNIAAPRPVRMGDLLAAAGVAWINGPENPDVIPSVVLDTGRLQELVKLPPIADKPAAMVAEWRSLGT